ALEAGKDVFGEVQTNGFLDKDIFARFEGRFSEVVMQNRGSSDGHLGNGFIGQHIGKVDYFLNRFVIGIVGIEGCLRAVAERVESSKSMEVSREVFAPVSGAHQRKLGGGR